MYTIFITKVASRLHEEGYLCFVTINPRSTETSNGDVFEQLDYSSISQVADSISFTQFVWGKNMDPPGPVYSYKNYNQFLEYVITKVPADKTRIGILTTGYDWKLPYSNDNSIANAISLRESINLARETRSEILFDEISQTPYFSYKQSEISSEEEHIVWFLDARSFQSSLNLISKYDLNGKGIWNIMIFYAQMWLVVNSQYNIIKLIPDNFTI
jgi:spore germination protein